MLAKNKKTSEIIDIPWKTWKDVWLAQGELNKFELVETIWIQQVDVNGKVRGKSVKFEKNLGLQKVKNSAAWIIAINLNVPFNNTYISFPSINVLEKSLDELKKIIPEAMDAEEVYAEMHNTDSHVANNLNTSSKISTENFNNTAKKEMMHKIFISHSTEDRALVKTFVEHILKLGLEISKDRIFCSSMEGHGVINGEDIPDRLRQEIIDSSLILLFISGKYKSSEICLNEMGAAWATKDKKNVIPILLSDVTFQKLGFLNIQKFGTKLNDKQGLLKLVQDTKDITNPNFDVTILTAKIEEFIALINSSPLKSQISESWKEKFLHIPEISEREYCFDRNIFPFADILNKIAPHIYTGFQKFSNKLKINQLFYELSKCSFLDNFWYVFSGGDFYLQDMRQLNNGNWLISKREHCIKEVWIFKSESLQDEFILFHSKKMKPYKIQSDVGGFSYEVGVMQDGTIISENERLNGYASINKKTIELSEYEPDNRHVGDSDNWFFIGSSFHSVKYNYEKTSEFAAQLDNQIIEVNEDNLRKFIFKLLPHPDYVRFR